jgi:hypothetical protein
MPDAFYKSDKLAKETQSSTDVFSLNYMFYNKALSCLERIPWLDQCDQDHCAAGKAVFYDSSSAESRRNKNNSR